MRWHINIEMFGFFIILWAALSELDGIFLLNKEQITAELDFFSVDDSFTLLQSRFGKEFIWTPLLIAANHGGVHM